MHNSRNTDYFTPYGLVRLAIEENDSQAAATVEKLFTRNNVGPISGRSPLAGFHPFDAVDDRYWCHYIGHSVFRALELLEKRASSCLPPVPCSLSSISSLLPQITSKSGSGHTLLTSPAGATALVSTLKGGIVSAKWPDGSTVSDFGWLLQTDKKLLVSHWWTTAWTTTITETTATTEGWLVAHKEHTSEPWKHILLRIASFVMGRRLIRILKKLVIFKKPLQSHRFSRTITWEDETLLITDKITGLDANDTLTRAPRTSKRHVASADSYHPEDLSLFTGVGYEETIERQNREFRCETRLSVSGQITAPYNLSP